MSQSNLTELARNGEPGAIANLLGRVLQVSGVEVSADWQGGQLNLRLIAKELPERKSLLDLVRRAIETLNIKQLRILRVFGHQPDNPAPLWHQQLDLTALDSDAAASQPNFLPERDSDEPCIDRFLICGLGELGQYCVLNLKRFALREFQIHVMAIDKQLPSEWEVHDLPSLLTEPLIMGDCRCDEMLLKAGVQHCRAVLLVTSNDSVNVEAAIAARRLNPQVRLVVRSSRLGLNELLKQQLGNFVAFDPTDLPASAFALAGLREGLLGYFSVGDYRLQVVEQQVQPQDFRFDGTLAVSMHRPSYRLLSYAAANATTYPAHAFYQWRPDTQVQAGDTIAYIEVVGRASQSAALPKSAERPWQWVWQHLTQIQRINPKRIIWQAWRWLNTQRIRLVIALGVLLAILLWVVGTGILLLAVHSITPGQAASIAVILVLGGYGDVFGGLSPPDLVIPGWVQVLCLLISIASLATVLGVLGLITDILLSSRFDFLRRQPAIPRQNHVVLVGFDRVGQRIAVLLQEFRQSVVAVTEHNDHAVAQPNIPVVVGDPVAELSKVNLGTAKSLIVVTDDQMLNLEVALMARAAAQQTQRDIGLVIRTYDQRFSDHLRNLLPEARILAACELSAEAFVGAAFGENILGLFRLNNQTILVTEYAITSNDTLVGKLLSQIAYGYGVVPIFHQPANPHLDRERSQNLMPSDDRQLEAGDRLILLASINGLRRIEHQEAAPPCHWRLTAQKPLNHDAQFFSRNVLVRISGCSIEAATQFTEQLPGSIDLWLYDYQADRLMEELGRQLPQAALVPIER